MSRELVLITGVSGFIGFNTLVSTLDAGYRVRAILRKDSQINDIKAALPGRLASNVEFAVVEDMAVENAFDHLMGGVSFILHIASPMNKPSDNYERDMFKPAIAMTVNMLSAAAKSATVKRVVVTSSITPFIPIYEYAAGKLSKKVVRADEETCHYDMKAQFSHELLAYSASKAMSLDAAEDFIKTHKLEYDAVFLMPSLVIGANPLAKTAEDLLSSTNAPLLGMLLGRPGRPMFGSSVSVQDVAHLHVLALDPSIPAGRYLAASGGPKGTNWAEAFGVVKKHFPESVGKTFVAEGQPVIVSVQVDTSETEKVFGFEFQSFDEQVKSVVENYIALL